MPRPLVLLALLWWLPVRALGQSLPNDAGAPVEDPDPDASPNDASTPREAEDNASPPDAGALDTSPADSPPPPETAGAHQVPAAREPPADPTSPNAPAATTPIEVVAYGGTASTSRVDRIRQSAQAVQVLDTEDARRHSADLGEVIARASGVGVRRGGGLGSEARISLNGLTDDQVRFFLHGVPLHLAGFPFGLANVPVNFIHRVEVYRGVVPARFGADALGGAINLVGEEAVHGTHGSASYQAGSFDTHRLSLEARDRRPESGFFSRVQGFFDSTRNDYRIEASVPNEQDQPRPASVHRFHDGYRAAGGAVELGFVHRPWAEELLLRVFLADYHKELQNDLTMSSPYGAVTYGETTGGSSLRYRHSFGVALRLNAIAGYAYSRPTFRDVSRCTYDWLGRCVATGAPGETDRRARDQVFREDNGYARAQVEWEPIVDHALRVTVAPTFFTRAGEERRPENPDQRDPLSAERRLASVVSALEYEARFLDARLENIVSVKNYLQRGRAEDNSPGANFRRLERDALEWGVSDALRYRFHDTVYAKASYERATRLPRPDEIFGDNVLVASNLELAPERSHNANLSVALDARESPVGRLRAEINGFLRDTDRLIQLLGANRSFSYRNVASARAIGLEASAGWTSSKDAFSIDGNVTYQSFRNTSRGSRNEGDRIPNRPYLFANGSAEIKLHGVCAPQDELTLSWVTRYVHAFFRGWESDGIRERKQVIPTQLSHTLALGYLVHNPLRPRTLAAFTLEAQNLMDAKVYDYYGVQRPGRAAFARMTLEF